MPIDGAVHEVLGEEQAFHAHEAALLYAEGIAGPHGHPLEDEVAVLEPIGHAAKEGVAA